MENTAKEREKKESDKGMINEEENPNNGIAVHRRRMDVSSKDSGKKFMWIDMKKILAERNNRKKTI